MSKLELNELDKFLQAVVSKLKLKPKIIVIEGENWGKPHDKKNGVIMPVILVSTDTVKKFRKSSKVCEDLWAGLQDGSVQTLQSSGLDPKSALGAK